MRRTLLLSAMAASLIAVGGLALAQHAGPEASGPQSSPMAHRDGSRGMWQQRGMRGSHHRMGRHHGPVGAVIGDLRQITRLYLMQGQPQKAEALYKEVLAKTQNPMLRNIAYDALARLQARPRDTGTAIATLRKSLDENLARVNAMPTDKH